MLKTEATSFLKQLIKKLICRTLKNTKLKKSIVQKVSVQRSNGSLDGNSQSICIIWWIGISRALSFWIVKRISLNPVFRRPWTYSSPSTVTTILKILYMRQHIYMSCLMFIIFKVINDTCFWWLILMKDTGGSIWPVICCTIHTRYAKFCFDYIFN